MQCAKHDTEVQAHWISTKQNSLADMLSRGQYTKIANIYLSLQSTDHIRDSPESWYIEIPLERVPARLFWYGSAPSTWKTYGTATNSYTEYCALFGKRSFPAQVGGLAA